MAGDSPHRDRNSTDGLAAGARVAGYRIEAPAGVGGMAVVYRARDERLQRAVALKVMAPALSADPGFRQRFIRESRAAAAVDDPHILPVYEAGEADGVLFIAMRFVSGGDLRSLAAREGQLPAARVAAFIAAAGSALDAAHAAGLVHRDVKPANMLVDSRPGQPDHLYLSDFGLSKGILSAASASLTGSAEVFGTPDYLAPEQAGGAPVDGRADQYALACAAFTLLAGQPVFERDHPMAVLLAHMSAPPPPVTAHRPDLPAATDEVLAKALAKDPGDRYSNCAQFATALRDAFGLGSHDATVTAAPTSEPAHPGQPPTTMSQPAPQGDAMEHAQTVTAIGKGSRQPDAPAVQAGTAGRTGGNAGTASITAPASLPSSAQRPATKRPAGRRRAAVITAIVLAMCLAIAVTWVAVGLPGTRKPLTTADRKPNGSVAGRNATPTPSADATRSPSQAAPASSGPARLLADLRSAPFGSPLPPNLRSQGVGAWTYADGGPGTGYVGSSQVQIGSSIKGETVSAIYDVFTTASDARAAFSTAEANFSRGNRPGYQLLKLSPAASAFCGSQAGLAYTSSCWFNYKVTNGIVTITTTAYSGDVQAVLLAMLSHVLALTGSTASPQPSASASSTFAEFAQPWSGHGRSLTIGPDGGFTMDGRTYVWCGQAAPPCDTLSGNDIVDGALATGQLTTVTGDIATGVVTATTDAAGFPTGPITITLNPASDTITAWWSAELSASFCGPDASLGTCGA